MTGRGVVSLPFSPCDGRVHCLIELQNKIGQSGGFLYHPKCKSLHITHLIFADDLFVLCGASEGSGLILCLLSITFMVSNLICRKVQYSLLGLMLAALTTILPIPEGSLPVRYLGVPRLSTRLRAIDCAQLKEKILGRIQSWSNKTLSYGGRLQLVISF